MPQEAQTETPPKRKVTLTETDMKALVGDTTDQLFRQNAAAEAALAKHLKAARGSGTALDGKALASGLRVGDPLDELRDEFPDGPASVIQTSWRMHTALFLSPRPGGRLGRLSVVLVDRQVVDARSIPDLATDSGEATKATVPWSKVPELLKFRPKS